MKKPALLCLSVFLFGCLHAQSPRFVRVVNNKLADTAGKPLFLEGVNLGGWLLWEEWIWGGGFNGETKMKERLAELLGDETYRDFLDKYYNSYITEKDIALIKEKGFNSIRLPFNYRLFDGDDARGWTIMDSAVAWCTRYKLYLIPDMHAAPGGQSPYFIADPLGKRLWETEENKQQAISIWKKIAAKYRDNPVIAGYDLLNEPKANKNSILVAFYEQLIRELRSVDPNHMLIAEGNQLAHDFKDFPAMLDSNQIYSYHYYSWFAERNKKNDWNKITKTIPGSLPLWCGEWGEDDPGNLLEARQVLKNDPRSCGMAFWTWKRVYKNNDRFPLLTIRPNGTWDKVMNWITWKIFKPNKDEVKRGIEEFLRAIRFGNCNFNERVREAALK